MFLDVDAANECLLWHGTRPDTAAIIGEQGFDEAPGCTSRSTAARRTGPKRNTEALRR